MTPRSVLKTLIFLGGAGCAHAPPGRFTGGPTRQSAPDLAPFLARAFDTAALTVDPATGLALSASMLGREVQYVPSERALYLSALTARLAGSPDPAWADRAGTLWRFAGQGWEPVPAPDGQLVQATDDALWFFNERGVVQRNGKRTTEVAWPAGFHYTTRWARLLDVSDRTLVIADEAHVFRGTLAGSDWQMLELPPEASRVEWAKVEPDGSVLAWSSALACTIQSGSRTASCAQVEETRGGSFARSAPVSGADGRRCILFDDGDVRCFDGKAWEVVRSAFAPGHTLNGQGAICSDDRGATLSSDAFFVQSYRDGVWTSETSPLVSTQVAQIEPAERGWWMLLSNWYLGERYVANVFDGTTVTEPWDRHGRSPMPLYPDAISRRGPDLLVGGLDGLWAWRPGAGATPVDAYSTANVSTIDVAPDGALTLVVERQRGGNEVMASSGSAAPGELPRSIPAPGDEMFPHLDGATAERGVVYAVLRDTVYSSQNRAPDGSSEDRLAPLCTAPGHPLHALDTTSDGTHTTGFAVGDQVIVRFDDTGTCATQEVPANFGQVIAFGPDSAVAAASDGTVWMLQHGAWAPHTSPWMAAIAADPQRGGVVIGAKSTTEMLVCRVAEAAGCQTFDGVAFAPWGPPAPSLPPRLMSYLVLTPRLPRCIDGKPAYMDWIFEHGAWRHLDVPHWPTPEELSRIMDGG